ncbi:DUF2059 domain-containing protein [Dyella sp. C9]|uniref:DUF2059 domain-containing protein n=1 Tax=Dyella sp. C9 TaxID=2202154 RepID=UPI001300B0B9|nr:DUF2059 domain-containing protein [Dyella sp. C9]
MRSFIAAVVLSSALAMPAMAVEAPPTDASLHKLLDVTHVHSLVDNMMAQTRAMMQQSVEANLASQSQLDDGQRKIISDSEQKMQALLANELAWAKLEPVYMDIYRKSFTQKEVDDMTAFYLSPSGQSMVTKMPQVMAQTMQYLKSEMATMGPQIQRISEDTANQLKAYNASKLGPANH